jgi:protein-tyrosine phosphatase
MGEHEPFRILAVCTGNLVRSALAEQLLTVRLGSLGSFVQIASAGAAANPGDPMPEQAEELSRRYGGNSEGHRARLLSAELVGQADLILTAEREHRAQVVSLVPRASRVTFTLNQFARLIESVTAEPLVPVAAGSVRELLVRVTEESAAQRGYLPPLADPALDDVIDPYKQSQTVYDTAGRDIDAAVTTISAGLLRAVERGRGALGGA